MFRRRAIKVSVVKEPKKTTSESTPTMEMHIAESTANVINGLAKDLAKYTALAVVGAVVAIKAADTLSQIAVKKTKSADKE